HFVTPLAIGARILVAWDERGREERLLRRHAACLERTPDAWLVAVRLRGVDVAVADFECPAHGSLALGTIGCLPDPEAEQGNAVAVGEHALAFATLYSCLAHAITRSVPCLSVLC